MMRTILAATSAFCLAAAPVIAHAGTRANDVVPASVSIDRDTQQVYGASALGEGESPIVAAIFLGVIVAGALIAIEILDDGDDDALSDG